MVDSMFNQIEKEILNGWPFRHSTFFSTGEEWGKTVVGSKGAEGEFTTKTILYGVNKSEIDLTQNSDEVIIKVSRDGEENIFRILAEASEYNINAAFKSGVLTLRWELKEPDKLKGKKIKIC
jgi:hypothetical protein